MTDSEPEVGLNANARLRSLSDRFRAGRDKILREALLRRRQHCTGTMKIVDMGGTGTYWKRVGLDFLEQHDMEVFCVNRTEYELSAKDSQHPRIKYAVGDACDMPFESNHFDFVHSNSVIEHVGNWSKMRSFANEVRRLAPDYYVQTPYFWFPIDPHFFRVPFFHWLPVSLRLSLFKRMRVGWVPAQPDIDKRMDLIESSTLLDEGQFVSLFPDAAVRYERLAALPKSLIAIRHAR
ncbi:MAG: hypothetical protein RL490_2228 [Pseudomonadota bacterium]|jgi:hypothetical protein